jgi:hypothetical protein
MLRCLEIYRTSYMNTMNQVLENMKTSFAVMVDKIAQKFVEKLSGERNAAFEESKQKIVASAQTCKTKINEILSVAEEKTEVQITKHLGNFKEAMEGYSTETMANNEKHITTILEKPTVELDSLVDKPSVYARVKIRKSAKKMEEFLLEIQIQALEDCEKAYERFEAEARSVQHLHGQGQPA